MRDGNIRESVIYDPDTAGGSWRQSTDRYLSPSCVTMSPSGVEAGQSKSKSLNRTDRFSSTTVRLASKCANASSSKSNSLLAVPITTFAYNSLTLSRNTVGWNWVPFVKIPTGWGHVGVARETDWFGFGGSWFCFECVSVCFMPSEQ